MTPERHAVHKETFGTMTQILTQGRGGPDHIYSLHEPQAYGIGKDKDRSKSEFGTKVTLAIDPVSGVIVGALNHHHTVYDGHVPPEARDQIQDLTGTKPTVMVGDHGYIFASCRNDCLKAWNWRSRPGIYQIADGSFWREGFFRVDT